MAEMPPSPIGLSPNPPQTSELSILEEGKSIPHSPPQEPVVEADASSSNLHKIIAEIVGTYILIFVGCGSAFVDKKYNLTIVGMAVAWGLVVMVLIYSLGHISGAQFNPAVTIALAAARKFPWKKVPFYAAAQVLGSTLASLTLVALFSKDDPRPMLTMPTEHTNDLNALILEFIISFILMFVIFSVGTDHRAINELTGVAVGGTIIFNILIAGPLTGASMNPARSVGPALVAQRYKGLWIYIIAPVLGTITAAALYSFFRLPDKTEKQMVKSAKN